MILAIIILATTNIISLIYCAGRFIQLTEALEDIADTESQAWEIQIESNKRQREINHSVMKALELIGKRV